MFGIVHSKIRRDSAQGLVGVNQRPNMSLESGGAEALRDLEGAFFYEQIPP